MVRLLENDGYEIVSFEEKADIYIVNTCSVTNIADRKSRQMLHKARKSNPDAIIVAVGCYVQTATEEALKAENIDLCIGNNHKGEIANILRDYLKERNNNKVLSDLKDMCPYDDMSIDRAGEHTRVFIKVQDGCNQFCTYCIIPYARGRARSRKREDVISEIKGLVAKGYQEFVITGIHLSSYGSDFYYEDVKADRFMPNELLGLLEEIAAIDGVKRIRLGSLEPRIIDDEFCSRLAAISKICPHFHLSLQSGSDSVLKRMNRHYTAEEFIDRCDILRKHFTHPAITTDVIVGFPGETDEEFEECVAFIRRVQFFETHIFKYSRRKGTPADTMKGQLTDAVKSSRSDVLEELERQQSKEYREYYLGKNVEVLFEETKDIEGKEYWIGHTREYVKVAVFSEENLANRICQVKVGDMLCGEYLLGAEINKI